MESRHEKGVENMNESKPKTVAEILDDVCTEICSHYCKYPEECEKDATGDEDLASEMLSAYCDKCPLMRL